MGNDTIRALPHGGHRCDAGYPGKPGTTRARRPEGSARSKIRDLAAPMARSWSRSALLAARSRILKQKRNHASASTPSGRRASYVLAVMLAGGDNGHDDQRGLIH